MTRLAGVSGTLFPGRYLEDGLARDLRGLVTNGQLEPVRRRLVRWWTNVEETCGPASGPRALFDIVAMPLAGMLGFRASGARFESEWTRARLDTPRGTRVALVVEPWSSRRPQTWRDLVRAASDIGADWCLLAAPPHVSLVDARGRAVRRSLDLVFPDALAPESLARWWWLVHASSFDAGSINAPAHTHARRISPIDRLLERAAAHQDAVGADLERGVERALASLAGATRRHGTSGGAAAFDQALTVVYRVLFLLFAESRDLVPRTHPIYEGAYSMATLAREALAAEAPRGLWEGLSAITRLSRSGCAIDDLVVSPFNGRLFARASAPSLEAPAGRAGEAGAAERDEAARRALVALGTRQGRAGREAIAYADLGVEELGAVYERVLDLDPGEVERTPAGPGARAPGREASRHSRRRKETGTFYTPRPLTEFVVRRTLEPLVDGRRASDILALRVLDPAMGSGAFLVAACRYLAAAYERALVDEGQLGEPDLDEDTRANIRRLVAERCLAGVDENPVAVELARLSIWLTTLARGKPLGFLDHRLRVGNSLLGASPDDLNRYSTGRRRVERADTPLFSADEVGDTMARLARPLFDLLARHDDSVDDVRAKERLWAQMTGRRSPLDRWRRACNLWCAQWLSPQASTGPAPRPSPASIRAAIDAIVGGDRTLPAGVLAHLVGLGESVARERHLFHWPLEFPDAFYSANGEPLDQPGFDAVIGNPPWEMLRRDPLAEPAGSGAGHGRSPVVAFIRESGVYRHSARGHLNLYQPFLERALALARRGGRVGLVMPWGLASDDGAAALRAELLDHHALDTIVGLDNARGLFPIHRGLRFLVTVVRKGERTSVVRGRFGVRSATELDNLPGRDDDPAGTMYPARLSPRGLRAVGGSRLRIPDARRPADLALAERLMAAFPRLGSPAGWGLEFGRELNVTEDRGKFTTRGVPVLEGKHVTPFQVDAPAARHHISLETARRLLGAERIDRPRLAYRDVSGVANRLSLIAAVVPAGVVTSHTLYCLRAPLPDEQQHFLAALLNSFVLNAIVRLFMGQHVTTGLVEDLPAPRWTGASDERRLADLSVERARRGPDEDLDARLQAGAARLYGLDEATLSDLVTGFPLVELSLRKAAVRFLARGPVAL